MLISIFSTSNTQDVVPSMLEGLQRLEVEYGKFDGVGIATLMDGRIQHQYTEGTGQDLLNLLQKQPISGHLGIAYMPPKSAKDDKNGPAVHFYMTERLAVVYHGVIDKDNLSDIRDNLWALGYEFETRTNGELVLSLIQRYLDLKINLDFNMEFSPIDAMKVSAGRLQGRFVIMALFAEPELLLAAGKYCPLPLGVNGNFGYLASDTNALSLLSIPIMFVAEGNPVVLRPATTAFVN
ncbi:MAG: hypothetical protein DRR19_29370 [Candidatus Parabeggiatoa sp. nov. 1]|nr:MAG: hypothetical protein DRR19_29370 [Gammaproteobacteria bacterium]